jgi:hypothetical protein
VLKYVGIDYFLTPPLFVMPFELIIFLSVIGIAAAVHAQYVYSKSPKKIPAKKSPLSDASFIDLARSIPLGDAQVREVWDGLLEAIKDKACSPELFLEMLGTLEGRSGYSGFNELHLGTLDEEGGDPETVSFYYLGYGREEITCPKKELLDAFHVLELRLNEEIAHISHP